MAPNKTNFAVEEKYEAFYTGGNVQVSSQGQYMFCGFGQRVKIMELDSGKIRHAIGQDDEEITSFCVSPNDEFLVLGTQNLLLRMWKWKEEQLACTWKAIHRTPVMSMGFDPTSTLLATGGSDSLVKLWDIDKQYCTHNLRGHTGVVRLVRFHPDISRLQLVSAAEDYTVRVWNLKNSVCVAIIQDHYTLVKDVCFTNGENTMYSCGGDKVVCVWDMVKLAVVKTIPVFESSECVMVIDRLPFLDGDAKDDHFVLVGSAGSLRVLNATTGSCAHSDRSLCEDNDNDEEDGKQIITKAMYCKSLGKIIVVTVDHNILFLNLDFTLHKQFSGHLEEVLDIGLMGKDGSHLVVVSNSSKVKVFNRQTMECQIVSGHTNNVLAVSTYPKKHLFATASKDNSVRLWRMDPDTSQVTCTAVGNGHTDSVNTVAFSRLSAKFLISGSEDETIKLWKIPAEAKKDCDHIVKLHAAVTEKAHEAEINFVAISPNDQFMASASRDKTAKLWSLPDMTLKGVIRGHRKGIWCVQFSPVDRCLVTASADGTINVWNLNDFSCIQTFEGHDSSVLKVSYISNGRQLISSDSEGLLKLWTLKNTVCEKTICAHEGKAWALTVHPSEQIIFSGAADSSVITWRDTTEEEIKLAKDTREKQILLEQTLSNYVKDRKFLKAIGLAITLDKPFEVLKLLKGILEEPTATEDLTATLCKLKPHQIGSLLRYTSKWNTNSRHCPCAQTVINIIFKNFTIDELVAMPDFAATLEGLIPYTERHFPRADRLEQQATFVDYTLKCMK